MDTERLDELEFINNKTGIKLSAKAPIYMEDLAELFSIFALLCGYQPETVKEYICPEGIGSEIYEACAKVRKEYEMQGKPEWEDDPS
jgi:hypothetical protein